MAKASSKAAKSIKATGATANGSQRKNLEAEATRAAEQAFKRANGKMPYSYYYDREMTKRFGKSKSTSVNDKNIPCE